MFLFSMSFNFAVYYGALTTSVPFLVSQSVLGTAWGCAGTAIGISQCVIPILYSAIISSNDDLSIGYRNLSFGGIVFGMIPVGFALWIYYWDYEVLDEHYF